MTSAGRWAGWPAIGRSPSGSARPRPDARLKSRGMPQSQSSCSNREDIMSARTPLEHRLAKKVGQAIKEHSLIQDGDRIMVGLSGGKDSWALIHILEVLRQRAPINFTLIAVNVDS